MACTSEVSIGYSIGSKPIITVLPFVVFSEGTMNGKDYYMWNDSWSSEPMIMFWDLGLDTWVVTLQTNTSDPLLYLDFIPQNDCPGISGENYWQITESGGIFEFQSFASILNFPPDPQCTAWSNFTTVTLHPPWSTYVFKLDTITYTSLTVGQPIYFLSSDTPFADPGTGYYTIGSLVFGIGATIYSEPGPGRDFYGIVIIDSNGDILLPGTNTGYICFSEPVPVNETEECFNILVWNKQCEFAQCVLKYIQALKFGNVSCEALENLKNQHRALEILNCYDTRDIPNNTTDYNTLSYSQIKKLLNS